MIYFGNSNKYLLERKGNIFYFFQAEKKVTKKPPAGNPCGQVGDACTYKNNIIKQSETVLCFVILSGARSAQS